MKYPLFAILLALFVFGCHEKLPDIEPVILHESDIPLFEVDSVVVLSVAPQINIRVYFSTRFEELTEEQKSEISQAIITRNGEVIHRESSIDQTGVPADTILFFDDIITEKVITCYEAFFRSGFSNSAISSRPTELCVDMRPGVLIPQMELSAESFTYNFSDNSKTLQIKNFGLIPFTWNLTSQASFLTSDVSNGLLNEGESINISLELDKTDLFTQDYNVELLLENDLDETIIISVEIHNYREEKWLISGRIVDAEYDKINDKIIAVSNVPRQIRKFDPETNLIESLSLPNIPTCISVSQDGQFAAVGYNNGFYYIDLSSMSIVEIYTEIENVFDIILAPNNWVYLSLDISGSGQSEIQCVNLDNGENFESTGGFLLYEKVAMRLHPSGEYLYCIEPISSSEIKKYDITGGIAQYLYESNTDISGHITGIWISDIGDKAFLNNKMVFNLSTVQSNEIELIGELEDGPTGNRLSTIDCSEDKICSITLKSAIGADVETYNTVQIYLKDDLSYLGEIKMPGFFNDTGFVGIYDSFTHFGFFNSDGTKFYAIATWERPLGQGPSNEWAIITKEVD